MKIIDAHMHFSHIASFEDCARRTSLVDYSASGYMAEAEANGIVHSICMGLSETTPGGFPDAGAKTPMLAALDKRLPPVVSLCPGINPHTLNESGLAELEALIVGAKSGVASTRDKDFTSNAISGGNSIVGFKIYAGYYHFDVSSPVYTPVYDLAEKHDLAVVIHTGDTYSDRGLLKYSHPLCVDELAVSRPNLRIVICHMGEPWIYDACEVAGKNANVYMDMSGMMIGNTAYFENMTANPLIPDRFRQALALTDKYEKVLFGTDWPLVPMGAYIEFCNKLIPPEAYHMVFYENAKKVFRL